MLTNGRILMAAGILLSAPAFAQQAIPQQHKSPITEAMEGAYQMGVQVGSQYERMSTSYEARLATLIEWLKAAQAENAVKK